MESVQSIGGFLTPYDYESITVSTTPIGFTVTKVKPTSTLANRDLGKARLITVSTETSPIRYTVHGTDPDDVTAVGHLSYPGSWISFTNLQAMLAFRAVRVGGTDATLKVTYWR